ncbi:predicted protein [Plenodomus lingam JN3]|uniref:Predicted protein n=1 Tax=Leptosphaeria maculans (strain JN3 / isolate v23.1.3 / race Av1-4-5-6-7-8) TaxID=985895 RepID=E4ZTQ5_LEPMJ|nr:predicted protein [Plenodomus lingam JN3]CBX94615.1 predicted protein [Plenodomus lingam JN3]
MRTPSRTRRVRSSDEVRGGVPSSVPQRAVTQLQALWVRKPHIRLKFTLKIASASAHGGHLWALRLSKKRWQLPFVAVVPWLTIELHDSPHTWAVMASVREQLVTEESNHFTLYTMAHLVRNALTGSQSCVPSSIDSIYRVKLPQPQRRQIENKSTASTAATVHEDRVRPPRNQQLLHCGPTARHSPSAAAIQPNARATPGPITQTHLKIPMSLFKNSHAKLQTNNTQPACRGAALLHLTPARRYPTTRPGRTSAQLNRATTRSVQKLRSLPKSLTAKAIPPITHLQT